MLKFLNLAVAGFLILTFFTECRSQSGGYQKLSDGVILSLNRDGSSPEKLRLQVIDKGIIRVTATPGKDFSGKSSWMTEGKVDFPEAEWTLKEEKDSLVLSTRKLKVVVALPSGRLRFTDTLGNTLLNEKGEVDPFVEKEIAGDKYYRLQQHFKDGKGSSFYGLGGNQLGLVALNGERIEMAQRNSDAYVPFLVSSGNYGILWDNNSITTFGDPEPYAPLSALKLYNKDGGEGGLTLSYKNGNADYRIVKEQKEIAYNFLEDLPEFSKETPLAKHAFFKWEGYLETPDPGLNRMLLYFGGYLKVWVDDSLLLDRWRQSWNPAEALLKFRMEKDKKHKIEILWNPDGEEAYLSLNWKKPDTNEDKSDITFTSETGKEIDYYFIKGEDMDEVVGGYRLLTGKSPILPIWAYGFWQSRERYKTQDELLEVVKSFRKKQFPLDNIVQDWFYWEEDKWGSQQFDKARFPDPKEMIAALHRDYHTHFMISVWPKFYTGTKNFDYFWKKGWLYQKAINDSTKDWIGYVATFYDAFNDSANQAFWQMVDTSLFSLGVDAWWLDATEPDIVSNSSVPIRKELMEPSVTGPAESRFNAYSLPQVKTFYRGQRAAAPDQRVFILTRSAFAGIQHYAAANWSGDIGSTWEDMKDQIATGISMSISGVPYWTMDIGGFGVESRYYHMKPADAAEWKEMNTRWFQFGAFCPLFRSHGQFPYREPFHIASENEPAYRSMLFYDKLRYRLLPYIYSTAARVHFDNYTIMRALSMDFPEDEKARAVRDQYLFGPDLLINPVYKYGARSREVYLPASASWYDLYTGEHYKGGQKITAEAPYSRMPVFVRAGAILPFGPALQYTQEKPMDTITLCVYAGQNGHFDLYEDDGLSYGYEKGQYAVIPVDYDDKGQTLTIGDKKGGFSGELKERIFQIKWIRPGKETALNFEAVPDQTIRYDGELKRINLKE